MDDQGLEDPETEPIDEFNDTTASVDSDDMIGFTEYDRAAGTHRVWTGGVAGS